MASETSVDSLLEKKVSYSGEGISVASLEASIGEEREQQQIQVETLDRLKKRNVEIQKSLAEEVKQLRKLSDYVSRGEVAGSWWARFKELLSYLPGIGDVMLTQRSVEELLRQQYEISVKRVKEAAEFADKLQVAESELFDELDRLNDKIIEAARNEDTAAEHVLQLRELKATLEKQRDEADEDDDGAERATIQRDLDRIRRELAAHSTRLQLYHTADSRLTRLKESTNLLVDTIGELRSDIVQYVTAASEKLDLVAGQIRAIGTAADASVVMLEMKKSLDSMTESLNETTRFVSETQVFFRENIDNLMEDLQVFDDETRATLKKNLELSKAEEEEQIARAVAVALERKGASSDASSDAVSDDEPELEAEASE